MTCLHPECREPATLECTYGTRYRVRHWRCDAHVPREGWFVEVKRIPKQLALFEGVEP